MNRFLLTAFVVALSSYAMAETPQIRAEQHTCQELQEFARNYGEVTVVYRPFFFKKFRTVSTDLDCLSPFQKIQFTVKSSDVANCAVGFYCQSKTEVTYHSGDRFPRRERFPHHPAPSRHDHYNPPSRSDRGPRYSPPSRSEHSSHYNPPSRDHGSHSSPSRDHGSHSSPSRDHGSHSSPSRDHGPHGCHGRHC